MQTKKRCKSQLSCLIHSIFFITAIPVLVFGANSHIHKNLAAGQFIQTFLATEPIMVQKDNKTEPENKIQIDVFKNDPLPIEQWINAFSQKEVMLGGQKYNIKKITAEQNSFDLLKQCGNKDFAYVYAYAEIEMLSELRTLLGIGSDDGVKVWLNGRLVHENWIGRPVRIDEDLVPVQFVQGKNTLLLKIQNQKYDWGFSCRILGPALYQVKLITYCSSGQLDAVKMLLDHGADVNSTTGAGLTPLHAAHISGRHEVADFLLARGADPDIPMPTRERLADEIVNQVIGKTDPGAAVLVSQDGTILYQKGFGMADRENGEAVVPESIFRIGSITKQFTATAILKLQEQGQLSLSDPLSKYIAYFPRGDQVTIYHLLTHTSGIHSFTSTPSFREDVKKRIEQVDLIQKIKKLDYDFGPGDKFLYNNSGYFLLGYIIEKASGMAFSDYLKKNIFEPLRMNNTGVYENGISLAHEAIGYSFSNSVSRAMDWDMSHAGAAGNLYSTVLDLDRWNEGIFNGRIVSQSSLNSAFTPAKLNDGSTANAGNGDGYGFGWVIGSYRGIQEIAHGGGLDGFSTVIVRYPHKKMTVVVLTNCLPNLPDVNPSEMARRIAEIYLWQEMEKQQSFSTNLTVSEEVLDRYIGQYDYTSAIMTITRTKDHLYAQLAGQPQFEIFPKSENEFFWKVADAQITFVSDQNGDVTHALHRQSGNTIQAPRMAEKRIASVDPKIYPDYVGDYQLAMGSIVSISAEDGKLYTQVTGQPKFELYPSSESEFFLKVVNARIQFIRNDESKVNELQLFQAGMQFSANRIK